MRRHQLTATARAEIRNLLKTSNRNSVSAHGVTTRRSSTALSLCFAMIPNDRAFTAGKIWPTPRFSSTSVMRAPRGMSPKQPRHFIVFTYDDESLTILRVLHDSMDIEERGGGEAEE
jgi:hypothetical protein